MKFSHSLFAFFCSFLVTTIFISGWRRISLLRKHKHRDSLSILPLERLSVLATLRYLVCQEVPAADGPVVHPLF